MKTQRSFCEANGHTPFDWGRFLKRRRYTAAELKKAVARAGSWVTCACGNQCDVLPRSDNDYEYLGQDRYIQKNEPLDLELSKRGMDFFGAIEDLRDAVLDKHPHLQRRDKAAAILRAIEKRATVLIRAHHAKANVTS